MVLTSDATTRWTLALAVTLGCLAHRVSADDKTSKADPLNEARLAIVQKAAEPLSDILNNRATEDDKRVLRDIVTTANEALIRFESDKETNGAATRNRAALLRALTSVFDAIANLDSSDAARSKLTDAAIELEIYVDDPDKHIAEAARLWQGLAYRLAGKPERSLKILHPILKPGTRSTIDLYGRFERCRALSAAGRHVAAVALAVRITEVSHIWPKGAGPAFTDAHTAARRLTADAYRAWATDLTKAGKTEHAATAQRRAQEIEDEIKDAMFDSFKLKSTVVGLDKP